MSSIPASNDDYSLRIQELAYGLKVRDVMTKHVFAVSRNCTMKDVRQIMKNNGISGVPVVENRCVVGIVSMHDIMNSFFDGTTEESVSKHMITDVMTVSDDVPMTFAMSAFSKHSYRRFPVVNQKNELVGIITPRNINLSLIRELSRQLNEIEEDAELAGSDKGGKLAPFSRTTRLSRHDFENGGKVSSELKKALKRRGVLPKIIRRAAIASYELEINIVAHSNGGVFTVYADDSRIRITANDFGPGIPDIEAAMTEGVSTASEWVRTQGFGAGMGLPNAKRVSDDFEIQSGVEMGTMVKAIIYINKVGAE